MPAFHPLPSTLFDTGLLTGTEPFEAWRDSISVLFDVAPVHVRGGGSGFRAAVQATHLGQLLLGDLHFGGQQFARSQSRLARDGLDHYLVQWYRSGGFVGQRDGRADIAVNAGDIVVFDLARSQATLARPSHVMSLIVPRALADEVMGPGPAPDLHGTVLRAGSPLAGLLGDHLLSLHKRLPSIALADAPAVSLATAQMVAACVRPSARTMAEARGGLQAVTLDRIQHYITRHLGAPLSPEVLCQTFGISRAALYRMFEPLGGVAHYVQQRRLLMAYHALANPANRRLRVAEVAARAGFASNAHFSRAFRAAFDVAPSDVRPPAPRNPWRAGDAPTADADGQASSAEYAAWVRSLQGAFGTVW